MVDTAELRRVPVFADLPDDQIAWFLSQSQELRLKAGDAYSRQGDPAEIILGLLGRGQVLLAVDGAWGRALQDVQQRDGRAGAPRQFRAGIQHGLRHRRAVQRDQQMLEHVQPFTSVRYSR